MGHQRLEWLGGDQRPTIAPGHDQFLEVLDRITDREDHPIADHAETNHDFHVFDLREDLFQLLLVILKARERLANQVGVGLERERDHLASGHFPPLQ